MALMLSGVELIEYFLRQKLGQVESAGDALIKKKIKFYSYIRKFRVEQLQSHI
jgi:hypothetical protein